MTPLHVAAVWGRRRHVKMLLSFGADWSLRNNRGRTPCHVAIRAGQRDLAQDILRAAAEQEEIAAERGQQHRNPHDVNSRDTDGVSGRVPLSPPLLP